MTSPEARGEIATSAATAPCEFQASVVASRPFGVQGRVGRWRHDVVLVGLAGSPMLNVFRGAGFPVAAEALADRPDPESAAAQALRIVEQGSAVASDGAAVAIDAQTLCIHGDTPGANRIAEAVARRLREAGMELSALRWS